MAPGLLMPTNARELQGYRVDIQESCIEVTKIRRPRTDSSASTSSSASPVSDSSPASDRQTSNEDDGSDVTPRRNCASSVNFRRPEDWSAKDLLTMVKLTPAQFLEFCDLLEPHGCSSTRMGLTHRARVFLFLLRELLNVYFPSHGLSRECYVNGFNFFYIPLSFHF